jgi:uncharacterized membrane protein/nitrite reductase/ring-hydroxylating ferredoxin subunit
MRSKASIKGHPIHPILVSFPIALLTGAFVLDLLAFFTGKTSYDQAAVYATTGGLIAGVAAAIPGIIDYYYTVPPESSAKKRATKHGLVNSTAVLIFTMTLLLRLKSETELIYILAMEAGGVTLLSIGGWLGGTLIIRNQIAVDHRYAEAGKWREETINTENKSIELKDLDSLKVNQMKLLRINDKRIAIARTEAGLIAFDDRCSHRGGSLADGAMICETVQCPWHGSQFLANTGSVKAGPAKEIIKTYTLEIKGNSVLLQL